MSGYCFDGIVMGEHYVNGFEIVVDINGYEIVMGEHYVSGYGIVMGEHYVSNYGMVCMNIMCMVIALME